MATESERTIVNGLGICIGLLVGMYALLLPPTCEARRRAEFPGFHFLLLRDVNGFHKHASASASARRLGVRGWESGADN